MGTTVKVDSSGPSKGLITLLLVLTCLISFLYFSNKRLKSKVSELKTENTLLSWNIDALTGEVERTKLRLNDSVTLYAAKVQALTLSAQDWKRLYSEEAKTVKKLKNDFSEVQSVATVVTVTKDSLIYAPLQVKGYDFHAEHKSKWIDISVSGNTAKEESFFSYEKRDSLMLINTIERKKLLRIIKYGKKAEKFEAVSFDEKTKIQGVVFKRVVR